MEKFTRNCCEQKKEQRLSSETHLETNNFIPGIEIDSSLIISNTVSKKEIYQNYLI